MTSSGAERFPIELRTTTPFGRVVAVALPSFRAVPDDVMDGLPAEEQALAAPFAPRRRATFAGGRTALRAALADLGVSAGPILWDARGAPRAPAGTVCSISHKDSIAVALAAPRTSEAVRLGIDVELLAESKISIARHVLTDAEHASIAAWPEADQAREVLLRFSLKESLYKALDPFVHRYVSFHEVECVPHADGTAAFTLALAQGERGFGIEAAHEQHAGFILTMVRLIKT